MIRDYDFVLDAKFGKEGTLERAENEEKAYYFTQLSAFSGH